MRINREQRGLLHSTYVELHTLNFNFNGYLNEFNFFYMRLTTIA